MITNVAAMWPRDWTLPTIKLGPTLTFPDVAWVPRDPEVLHTEGMISWFSPTTKLLFTIDLDNTKIEFHAMGLWDSHPDGRVGLIVDRSPRSQHMFLRKYFLNFDAVRCQLAKSTQWGKSSDIPASFAPICHTDFDVVLTPLSPACFAVHGVHIGSPDGGLHLRC